jgi:CRISPR-associated protein Csh2
MPEIRISKLPEFVSQLLPNQFSKETIVSNVKRSDFLFLSTAVNCLPNGDPFTGEQRYDDVTSKILISDVRIKRYIRDYFTMWNGQNPTEEQYQVYLTEVDRKSLEKQGIDIKDMSGSAAQMKFLKYLYQNDPSVRTAGAVTPEVTEEVPEAKAKGKKSKKGADDNYDSIALLIKCIDTRLFGAVSTEEGNTAHLTGPVQFENLNSSLNKVNLRMHQNTSHFESSTDNKQGAIGTTSLVPFALNFITGSTNPLIADKTNLTEQDMLVMCTALWNGLNSCRSRHQMGQDSRLLVKINYKDPFTKCSYLRKLIKIKETTSFDLRDISDVTLDFSALAAYAAKDNVVDIEYMVEDEVKDIFLAQMDSVKSKLRAL